VHHPTAFRPRFLKVRREQWLAEINKVPLKRRAEYKRSVIEHGLGSEFVLDALGQRNPTAAPLALIRPLLLWSITLKLHQRRLRGHPLYSAA
jgi:hypothetical protein